MNEKHYLFIDIETFGGVDLSESGVYRYAASPRFEILLVGCAVDDGSPVVLETVGKDAVVPELEAMLKDPHYLKVAHNANFEMNCLHSAGYTVIPEQWADTMVLAEYASLPPSLAGLSTVLHLGKDAKLDTGKALIEYFCKPHEEAGERGRYLPEDNPDGWRDFIEYNKRDVIAEREVFKRLRCYDQPNDHDVFYLDLKINRRGVGIDTELVSSAIAISEVMTKKALEELKTLTGLENPNSNAQFAQYLNEQGYSVENVNKSARIELYESSIPPKIARILELKDIISKASVKKYQTAQKSVCDDGRLRGAFQYYGSHTGRWAGRKVQLQNLRRNKLENLSDVRELVRKRDFQELEFRFGKDHITDVLSQLVRTMLVPSDGNKFIVADFSAIEARVIAWLAGETWREKVFAADGDIYVSSYAQAFGVPVDEVSKDLRQIGKVMELALGYGGSVGAMKQFGAEKLGMIESDMQMLVSKWRATSPQIVQFWYALEDAAIKAIRYGAETKLNKGLVVKIENSCLAIRLPSGRTLYYQKPTLEAGEYGDQITYEDVSPNKKSMVRQKTYGGKLTENVVQAIARDCLAAAMLRLDTAGYEIVSHVHDEVIIDAPLTAEVSDVERIMGEPIDWAPGLHLTAKGYEGAFYFKD